MQKNPTNIFIHFLKQLKVIVNKIEMHQHNDTNLLHKALYTDMLPLIAQVRTAANFSLRGCCPLAGRPRINFNNNEDSCAGLHQQLDATIIYLQSLPEDSFQSPPENIHDKAGFTALTLSPSEYLDFYILPNFFFHLSMAYAMARHAGVVLGKGDFDGYHTYPNGFSFVQFDASDGSQK